MVVACEVPQPHSGGRDGASGRGGLRGGRWGQDSGAHCDVSDAEGPGLSSALAVGSCWRAVGRPLAGEDRWRVTFDPRWNGGDVARPWAQTICGPDADTEMPAARGAWGP